MRIISLEGGEHWIEWSPMLVKSDSVLEAEMAAQEKTGDMAVKIIELHPDGKVASISETKLEAMKKENGAVKFVPYTYALLIDALNEYQCALDSSRLISSTELWLAVGRKCDEPEGVPEDLKNLLNEEAKIQKGSLLRRVGEDSISNDVNWLLEVRQGKFIVAHCCALLKREDMPLEVEDWMASKNVSTLSEPRVLKIVLEDETRIVDKAPRKKL